MDNPFNPGYWRENELKEFGFASIGENVAIAKNCTIIGLQNISIGDNVRIDGGTVMAASTGHIRLGSYIHIGGMSFLAGAAGITMDDFSGLSQSVKIYSASDDYSGASLTNPTVPRRYLKIKMAAITIGRHVIIGSGSVVLPGCSVGEGAAIGALSLVTKPLTEWGVYHGNPAKRIKDRKRDLLHAEKDLLSVFMQPH
jgi:acetyltransferase-like isoleucine patch superfamily enzyme